MAVRPRKRKKSGKGTRSATPVASGPGWLQGLLTFYQTTGTRQLAEVEDRLVYLDRFFLGRRAGTITPPLITEYVAARQADTTPGDRAPANRTISIELAILKRMLRLAWKHGRLLRLPPIDILKDAAPREGFFEDHQYEAVRRRLPDDLQAAIAIMHTFGWRKDEVLTLDRRQLDLKAGTLRLDPGTTKNSEGRVVYLKPSLKALLAAQVERGAASRRSSVGSCRRCSRTAASGSGPGRRGEGSASAGRLRAWPRACPGAYSTTFGGPRCGTLSAEACPAPSA